MSLDSEATPQEPSQDPGKANPSRDSGKELYRVGVAGRHIALHFPKDVSILIATTCEDSHLQGKRDFADAIKFKDFIIKLRNLRWGIICIISE